MSYFWVLWAGAPLTAMLIQAAPSSRTFDCSEWTAPVRAWQLPVDWLERACRAVDVRFHQAEDWGLVLLWQSETEDRPTLSLLEGAYAEGVSPRPLSDLTVDVTEPLFYRLLLVDLERIGEGDEPGSPWLRTRADELLLSVPAEYRGQAYHDALASFGSHVFSLRLLIEAKQRQRLVSGASLCNQVRESGPLFRLWNNAFASASGSAGGDGFFPGQYWISDVDAALKDEGVADGEVSDSRVSDSKSSNGRGAGAVAEREPVGAGRYSTEVLTREDKKWLVDTVFEGRFVGNARADFESSYCLEIDSGP